MKRRNDNKLTNKKLQAHTDILLILKSIYKFQFGEEFDEHYLISNFIKTFRCAAQTQKTPPRAFQTQFLACEISRTIGIEWELVPFSETPYSGPW